MSGWSLQWLALCLLLLTSLTYTHAQEDNQLSIAVEEAEQLDGAYLEAAAHITNDMEDALSHEQLDTSLLDLSSEVVSSLSKPAKKAALKQVAKKIAVAKEELKQLKKQAKKAKKAAKKAKRAAKKASRKNKKGKASKSKYVDGKKYPKGKWVCDGHWSRCFRQPKNQRGRVISQEFDLTTLPPNLSKGTADGKKLPPYDPFYISEMHDRHKAKHLKRINERAARINFKKECAAKAAKRRALEKKRVAHAKKRLAKLKKIFKNSADFKERERRLKEKERRLKSKNQSFMELDMDADADADADVDAEADADADAEGELAVAHEVDMDLEGDSEAESENESEASLALHMDSELDIDAESGAVIDPKYEAELAAESEMEHMELEPVFLEIENMRKARRNEMPRKVAPVYYNKKNGATSLTPTQHVNYGRNELAKEFEINDNKAGRSVFKRRDHSQKLLRFEKQHKSVGGVAKNGASKLPCNRDVTIHNLMQPVLSTSFNSRPVTAKDPEALVPVDDNIAVIKKLPVVPEQHRDANAVDQYGDKADD